MPNLTALNSIEESDYAEVNQYISKKSQKPVDTFCKLAEDANGDSDRVESELWRMWTTVIAKAASTSHESGEREDIVNFLSDIQTRPTPTKDGKDCTVQEATVWKDLPVFGMQMRETWNSNVCDDDKDQTKQEWINLNAWTATLTASAKSKSVDALDFSLYGIWAVRSALEENEPSNVDISAAAVWFIYASSTLWKLSQQQKTFDGKMAKPGWHFKDQEWRGYTKDRWETWTKRFNEVKGQVSDDATAKLVAKALQAMSAVDGQ